MPILMRSWKWRRSRRRPPAEAGVNPPDSAGIAVRPSWRSPPAARLRHPGWSWTVGRDWLVPSAVAVSTLFVGAALGGVPVLLADSWDDPQTRIAVWASAVLGLVGLLALTASWLIWHGRSGILRRNGTAYVIQEIASGWSADDSRAFLRNAKRTFARMIEVPGPGRLDGPWDWPLRGGARDWDGKVAELVRAFQALRSDDDPVTPNGIFMWAWAPVALAFGARVTAADRGLILDVWQRPSTGRAGSVPVAPWFQSPHRFGLDPRPETVLPADIRQCEWPVRVSVRLPEGPPPAVPRKIVIRGEAPLIMLVRLGRQCWGPVPDASVQPEPDGLLAMALEDEGGLGLGSIFKTVIHELRIVPPEGSLLFPWAAYPALVSAVADWIRGQAAAASGRPVLLGTIVPPEVALGLGITAAQAAGPAWPEHLWPIVADPLSRGLVVPHLDLGASALRHPGSR
jgi:hypothetical protein